MKTAILALFALSLLGVATPVEASVGAAPAEQAFLAASPDAGLEAQSDGDLENRKRKRKKRGGKRGEEAEEELRIALRTFAVPGQV